MGHVPVWGLPFAPHVDLVYISCNKGNTKLVPIMCMTNIDSMRSASSSATAHEYSETLANWLRYNFVSYFSLRFHSSYLSFVYFSKKFHISP